MMRQRKFRSFFFNKKHEQLRIPISTETEIPKSCMTISPIKEQFDPTKKI